MIVFLDTSSLIKLYYREEGTRELELMFSDYSISDIYLAEISRIEFLSAIWKKVRTKEMPESEATTTLGLFDSDKDKYNFIPANNTIVEQAISLISVYGIVGLRTLDSIQFATALALTQQAQVFITADKLLKSFFQAEGLPTETPDQ